MHEHAWLHGNDLDGMISLLGRDPDPRKARLTACAYIRRLSHLVADKKLRAGIEAAEDHADYRINREQLKVAREAIRQHITSQRETEASRILFSKHAVPDWAATDPDGAYWSMLRDVGELPVIRQMRLVETLMNPSRFSLSVLSSLIWQVVSVSSTLRKHEDERRVACILLRDIFGNRFRRFPFADEWRTDAAVAIARGMYESRDFEAMPILADALQDAGCDNTAVLNHCRGASPDRYSGDAHVRGCWVVDLVLGKV